jgi:hypothetical protein
MADVDNVTCTISRSCKVNSETYITGTESIIGGVAQVVDVTLGTVGAHDVSVDFDHSKVQAVFIQTDLALTSIVFTGTTGPVTTPAIAAGGVWEWSVGNAADPFGASCTKLVVTTTVADTTLKIRVVETNS